MFLTDVLSVMYSYCAKFIVLFQVRTVRVETRKNEIVNRLNKTKTEQTPDLKGGVCPSVYYLLRPYLIRKVTMFCSKPMSDLDTMH